MARLRYNGLATGSSGSLVGLTLGASLTSGATSVTFNAALTHSNGTAVPTISGSDYIPLEILDTNGRLSEIVYLTAYTAGATTGTISRGKEGTTGVAHSSGDKIAHGSTVQDIPAGFTQLRKSATQTIPSGTWTVITWDTEDADTMAAHDNVTNNSRITAPTAGVYNLNLSLNIGTGGTVYMQYSINGTRVAGRHFIDGNASNRAATLSRNFSLAAGDYVEGWVFIGGGGTLTILSDDECVMSAARIAGA